MCKSVLIFALCFLQASAQPRIFETEIEKTVECLRNLLYTGLPPLLPPLSDIELPNIDLDFGFLPSELLAGHINFTNFHVQNVTNWTMSNLGLDFKLDDGIDVSLKTIVTLPLINITSNYNFSITAAEYMKLWGVGTLDLDMINLNLDVHVEVNASNMTFRRLRIVPSVKATNFIILGMFDDEEQSEILSKLAGEMFQAFINSKGEDLADVLEGVLMFILNLILGSKLENYLINEIFTECPLILT